MDTAKIAPRSSSTPPRVAHWRRAHAAAILALALTFAFGGCGGSGGGGGGGTPGNAQGLFVGDYRAQFISGDSFRGPRSVVTTFGRAAADGLGSFLFGGGRNTDGTIDLLPELDYGYEIAADLTWRLPDAVDPTLTRFKGAIAGSGDLVLAADLLGSAPGIWTFIRRAGAIDSDDDLNGTYHFALLQKTPSAVAGMVGRMGFDGAGAITTQADWVNLDGTAVLGGSSVDTYAVRPDGDIILQFGSLSLTGRMLPNGELMILSGGAVAGEDPALLLLTPVSTTASTSLFVGEYALVYLNASSNRFFAAFGVLDADGAGGVEMEITFNGEVTGTGASPPFMLPYGVTPNGTVSFNATASELQGGISPSGDFFVLGGPVTSTPGPTIMVGMRR